jgi:hypothetical protein
MRISGSYTYPWYYLGAAVLAVGSFLVLGRAEGPAVRPSVNRDSSAVAESSKGAVQSGGQLTHSKALRAKQATTNSRVANRKSPIQNPKLVETYGNLPLSFEINQGQTDSQVKFLSRGHGYTLFLTGEEAVLSLRSQKSGVRSQEPAPGNWKLETGNWKFDSGNWPIWNLQSEISSRQSLLPRPTDYGPRITDTVCPKSQIQNPKSQIQNLPAPSPQHLEPAVVRLKLVGANPRSKIVGMNELPGKSNYFIGNDPKKWRTNVSNYAKVRYADVYPGVDLVYYGNQGQLEYDFVVAPGADPAAITLAVETGNSKLEIGNSKIDNGQASFPSPESRVPSPDGVRIDAQGDLVIATDAGEVRFRKPVVYQPQSAVGSRQLQRTTDQRQRTPRQRPIQNPKSQIANSSKVATSSSRRTKSPSRLRLMIGAYLSSSIRC